MWRAVIAGDAEIPAGHPLIPVAGCQPELCFARLGQHGEIALKRRRRAVDVRLENSVRSGLTGGELAAVLGVNGDWRAGHRLLVLQVDGPHESVTGAQFESQVGMAQHHQERPFRRGVYGRAGAHEIKPGRWRATLRGRERDLHRLPLVGQEIDRQDP